MSDMVVVVHAGAGRLSDDLREREPACRDALAAALSAAARALAEGGDAVAAVRSAVIEMESFPLFNAGYGSALCADGSVEMSAGLMRGPDRAAGAVAAITRTRHPILGAEALLDAEEVLMVGPHADAFAAAHGAEQWEPWQFVTERQRRRLELCLAARGDGRPGAAARGHGEAGSAALGDGGAGGAACGHGTVGAVCRDAAGDLAAATSTGGRMGQPPGRVGDPPVIGAGTWADGSVAVSCTGDGESFIRAGAGRLLSTLVERGAAVAAAAGTVLEEVRLCQGTGGLIAVDARGRVATRFTSEAMPRGVWREGGGVVVEVV
ncbi:MAG TPA: isoaspartyl peptidase/L-asparaginase [Solirubrobacteraceae bacterium]|nr:isoaspartyl peptidase/L-asparaginase [Solirubrobacteraceae bacterium]